MSLKEREKLQDILLILGIMVINSDKFYFCNNNNNNDDNDNFHVTCAF